MRCVRAAAVVVLVGTTAAAAEPLTIPVERADAAALRAALRQVRELRAGGQTSPVVVELPGGTYRLSETISLDPVVVGEGLTIKAASPGEAILSGARALGPPTRDEAGRWRFALPEDWRSQGVPRQLLVNGRLRSAARHPNSGYFRIERALEDRRSGFIAQEGDLPAGLDLAAGSCDLILLHDWSSSRLPVASYTPQDRVLRTLGPIGCEAPHYAIDHFEPQPRYWLEGHPLFADAPGEWFLDLSAGAVVLLGEPGEETAPAVELPWVTELLAASGREEQPIRRLSLEGLVFTGARFPMPPGGLAEAQATMHEPRDAEGRRSTPQRPILTAAVRVELGEECRVAECRFEGLGTSGLWLAGRVHRSQVVGCRFDDLGGNGVNLGEDTSRRAAGRPWYQAAPEQVPTDNRLLRCEISHCGRVLPGAVAVWAPFNLRLEIAHNHIHDCPYTGVSLGWMWNESPTPAAQNRIHHNRIEYVMQILSDGGGIYTLGRQPESLIEANDISDVPLNAGRAESNGLFLDEGTTGFTIRGNTIRRVTRSPLRFHRAGKNLVQGNRWELATADTPPVRFNNTPEENITIEGNEVLEPQKSYYLIGNSLTWDAAPSQLEGYVRWHVDCGKSLPFLQAHPERPCVTSSRVWPEALTTAQYDVISVQPHYGSTLAEDVEVISEWVRMQPRAVFVIHTGWARHRDLEAEWADADAAGPLTHSPAYFTALLAELRRRFPDREFRRTVCQDLLHRIHEDIAAGRAPWKQLSELYRDDIHLTLGPGRYLMHNALRAALGQPRSAAGFPDLDPEQKAYLDALLAEAAEWAERAEGR